MCSLPKPIRESEFAIDLKPITQPISTVAYYVAIVELKEI